MARVWDAEAHGHGISFLQSFFLCACLLKEKSVKQIAQTPRLQLGALREGAFFSMRALIRERDGYCETDNLRVGVGAHDDPGASAYRERNTSSVSRQAADTFPRWGRLCENGAATLSGTLPRPTRSDGTGLACKKKTRHASFEACRICQSRLIPLAP